MNEYTEEIPSYGDVMTVADFRKNNVETGFFIDYDGSGHPAKDGKMSRRYICPSLIDDLPADATHVVWFNK